MSELKKRIITSIILLSLLVLIYFYSFIMVLSVILVSIITWIEFYNLIYKIYKKKNKQDKFLRFFFKGLSLIYLMLFSFLIFIIKSDFPNLEVFIFYSIIICISSDIGGLIIGKIFKGKKLTKISPNKTISGSIGSFVFGLILIPFFQQFLGNINIYLIILITLLISLTSQLGDLFISFLKRKANVKDTGDLLPGHGGFLDRLDGIIFSIPFGVTMFVNF